jgi:hypothetical protein
MVDRRKRRIAIAVLALGLALMAVRVARELLVGDVPLWVRLIGAIAFILILMSLGFFAMKKG